MSLAVGCSVEGWWRRVFRPPCQAGCIAAGVAPACAFAGALKRASDDREQQARRTVAANRVMADQRARARSVPLRPNRSAAACRMAPPAAALLAVLAGGLDVGRGDFGLECPVRRLLHGRNIIIAIGMDMNAAAGH